jgi:hypothetical protein
LSKKEAVVKTRTPILFAAILGSLLVAPSTANADFCRCGFTSKEVRHWNNNALATPRGQARIDRTVTAAITANPPAVAPFIEQSGRVVKSRARGIAHHSLAWFKDVYKRCPSGSPGCRAMRNCLIAGYGAYLTDRLSGLSVRRALRDATLACIVAAFTTLAGRPADARATEPHRVQALLRCRRGHAPGEPRVPLALTA